MGLEREQSVNVHIQSAWRKQGTMYFPKMKFSWRVNCTPKVGRYDILKDEWGVVQCQREYRKSNTAGHSSKKSWKKYEKENKVCMK